MSVPSRRWARVVAVAATMVVAPSGIGCVGQASYEAAIEQASRARADAQAREVEVAVQREREAAMVKALQGIELRLRDAASTQVASRQLQDLLVQNAELSLRVQRAELAVAAIAKQHDGDDGSARGLKAPIEDLDVRRVSLDRSDEAIRELLRAVQPLVDAGRIRVTIRDGRVRLQLPRRIDEVDPYSASGSSSKSRGALRVGPQLASPDP